MRKQKTVEIDGSEYLITQFGAIEGLRYQKALARILLPALSEIFRGSEEVSQQEAMSLAMSKLADNIEYLDENMIKAMIVNGVTKENMSIDFNNEFSGEYVKLFRLIQEVVMFNFGSVFTMFGSEEEETTQ